MQLRINSSLATYRPLFVPHRANQQTSLSAPVNRQALVTPRKFHMLLGSKRRTRNRLPSRLQQRAAQYRMTDAYDFTSHANIDVPHHRTRVW